LPIVFPSCAVSLLRFEESIISPTSSENEIAATTAELSCLQERCVTALATGESEDSDQLDYIIQRPKLAARLHEDVSPDCDDSMRRNRRRPSPDIDDQAADHLQLQTPPALPPAFNCNSSDSNFNKRCRVTPRSDDREGSNVKG